MKIIYSYLLCLQYILLYFIQVNTCASLTKIQCVTYNTTPSLIIGGKGRLLGQLDCPFGVAVHNLTGSIYVADSGNNKVCEFNSTGQVMSCMMGYVTYDDINVSFAKPYDIHVMSDGRLIVCDEHRVMVMYDNMTLIYIWGSRSEGWDLGQFAYPASVTSYEDLIYVADSENGRVQILSLTSPDYIEEISMAWSDAPGKIYGVSVEPLMGDIYITRTSYEGTSSQVDRIIIYSYTGQYLRNFSHADLRVDEARLDQITVHMGQMYISDVYNHCIHILTYGGTYVQRLGEAGTCHSCFQDPSGVSVNSMTGQLIVADSSNNNIQVFSPVAQP